jgi:murein DD-endopeptidase MepM/ murein hydrolase activator NlpD
VNRFSRFLFFLLICPVYSVLAQAEETSLPLVRLKFPTANHYLIQGKPEKFYQPTVSRRAISGMYGFVRSSEPEPARFFDLFHEGIDIQPLHLDGRGEPTDPILAAAAGEVVYVNNRASRSNYGRYIIIRHRYGSHDLYTTYGHLASLRYSVGQKVSAGETIGILGWTGNVGTRSRAHLHFETGFLVHEDYDNWYRQIGQGFEPRPSPNEHGNFTGLNFLGINPVDLLLATAEGKPLSVPEIFQQQKTVFRVRLPAGKTYFNWQTRFPEQVEGGLSGGLPVSWEVDCSRTGLPLRFRPSDVPVGKPELLWFDHQLSRQESYTRGLVQNIQGKRSLSRHGLKWFSQLTWQR